VLVVARSWTLRAAAGLVAMAAALVGPVWYALEPTPHESSHIPIAVVQAGVVHGPATRLHDEIAATEQLPPGRFGLVVWGESSVGFDLFSRADVRDQLQALAARQQTVLLVNVDAASPSGAIRKTSVLIGPSGILDSYAKMRLVPFGEYIPLRPVLGWLSSVSKAAATNRVRGDQIVVMHAADTAFAPLICFESAFPDMSRTAVRDGADLLIFQTATTTFQGSWAPEQHASLAAVRAAETGRPTVQASLSGTTAAFDARGHRVVWWPAATGTVTFSLPQAVDTTPFDRLGEWVLAVSFAVLAVAALSTSLASAEELNDPQGLRPAVDGVR
jgi:apolipoprotein N-acyltransferase